MNLIRSLPADFDAQIDESRVQARLARGRLREFMRRLRLTALSGPLPSAYLAWLVSDRIDHQTLIGWWFLLLAIDGTTVLHTTAYLRANVPHDAGTPWLRRQILLQTLAGVAWGSAMNWGTASPETLRDIGLVLLAVFSVAVIGVMHFRVAVLCWAVGVWTPPAIVLLTTGDEHNLRLVVGILVLVISLNFYLWEAAGQLVDGMEKRFRADALAEALGAAVQRIHRLATFDELTGCLNRREGLQALQRCLEPDRRRAPGTGADTTCVLMLDVDHFKHVNDTHGHPAGDAVLREVSQRLATQLRDGDTLARVGGEEFLVVLPGTAPGEAQRVAQRLLDSVAQSPIPVGETALVVTISIGLTATTLDTSAEQVLSSADKALYQAKHRGRNRVVCSLIAA